MRALVCGSPDWTDEDLVHSQLWGLKNTLPPGERLDVYHGGYPTGADAFAHRWANRMDNLARSFPFPPDWYPDGQFDRGAGLTRNARLMAHAQATRLYAFALVNADGRTSKETTDLILRALAAEFVVVTFQRRRT